MLNENDPLFERYVAEEDPLFHAYQKKTLPQLKENVSSDRVSILNLVNQLNEEQLQRTGQHKIYGSIALARWCDFFLLHEAHHLWTIFQLTSAAAAGAHK